jgi:hypothetical protein
MSTRACYRFFPLNGPNDWPGVVTVYKHRDGYPSGAAQAIEAALPHAWPLPRFEPDEFAAAFVRGNKKSADDFAVEFEQQAAGEDALGKTEDANWLRDRAKKYRTDPGYRSCCGGDLRLVPFEGLDGYQRFAGDIAYLYDIRCENGKIRVTAYTASERDDVWTVEKFFEGSIKQLKRRRP